MQFFFFFDTFCKELNTYKCNITRNCVFSSPEHYVLKRSFLGGDVSVIRRASSTISFKHLLLPNSWANLDQTWQECSLGSLFKNCSQNLIASKTLVAMATKLNFLSNSLKIFSKTADPILK